MAKRYIYDKESLSFRKERFSFARAARWLGMFILLSLSLTVSFYLVFALVFNTKQESALIVQNRAYDSQIPSLEEKSAMLSSEIRRLESRDEGIYSEIFQTDPPRLDVLSSYHLPDELDSIPDSDIVIYTSRKAEILSSKAERIEANLCAVLEAVSSDKTNLPPLLSPIAGASYAQIGASVGEKINPYYKVTVPHGGLDIISEADVPVRASAPGVVKSVVRSMKGHGNMVTLSHSGDYETRYAHLAAISVRPGARVTQGQIIGYVGISGNAYAPHLHYEVHRDSLTLDPVNHLFASVGPYEYVNMLITATNTKQSMD